MCSHFVRHMPEQKFRVPSSLEGSQNNQLQFFQSLIFFCVLVLRSKLFTEKLFLDLSENLEEVKSLSMDQSAVESDSMQKISDENSSAKDTGLT